MGGSNIIDRGMAMRVYRLDRPRDACTCGVRARMHVQYSTCGVRACMSMICLFAEAACTYVRVRIISPYSGSMLVFSDENRKEEALL